MRHESCAGKTCRREMNNVANSRYTLHTLDNGLRVVIERMPDVRSAAAGFLVRTGARDEVAEFAGVSHFLEHMMFKGTSKRTWRDITIDFDQMGSTYNAFTSEDRTVYYGWVRKADIGRQIELLADMLRSTLPDDEFETEKKVVLEEIAMSKDSLEHVTFDFLQEKVFVDHPLSWPILGYEKTVAPLTRDRLWEYFERRYTPDNVMLIVAGNVDPAKIIALAEEYCGSWKSSAAGHERSAPTFRGGTSVLQVDRFKQQVIALVFPSISARDERAETAEAAATILGGDNSRVFWNVVQKGLATQAGAHQMEFTDFGVMTIYGVCKPENAEQLLDALRTEANDICTERIREHEVERVKNKRRTSLAVECEAPYYRLTQLMDDMEYHGAPRTVEQMLAEVDAISVDTIYSYFQDYPVNVNGHLVSVGQRRWPEADK